MTIKKKRNIFDTTLKNLESIRVNPIINKKDAGDLLTNVNSVMSTYPETDIDGPIKGLTDVTINSEKFIPIIDLQIHKNKLLKKDYIKLDKLIDKKKKKMVEKLKNIKKDVIEGFSIEKAIKNSPLYKEAKRVYNKLIEKLNEIKKKIKEAIKELDKLVEFIKKIKDELEGAIFSAKDKIENATEKLNKAKENAEENSKSILEDSVAALRRAKLDAKNVRIGVKIKVKYLIIKAKGGSSIIPFLDKDKIDTSMKIIKNYDPNMVSNMMRKGMNNAMSKSKESNKVTTSKVNIKTTMDTGPDITFGPPPKLEGFSNQSRIKSIFNLFLIGLTLLFIVRHIKEINNISSYNTI